jgi:hypothetical protein
MTDHGRKRCGRDNFILIIPNNNSLRNHYSTLLPKYQPAVNTASTTTFAFSRTIYRTSASVILLMTVKVLIRTGHEGQGEEYMYIYTLSLTSDLDAFERSTPRIDYSNLKKDTWCPFTRG